MGYKIDCLSCSYCEHYKVIKNIPKDKHWWTRRSRLQCKENELIFKGNPVEAFINGYCKEYEKEVGRSKNRKKNLTK